MSAPSLEEAERLLRGAFSPVRARAAEAAAALGPVRNLGDALPALSRAGLLPEALGRVTFGETCPACGGVGGRRTRTRSGLADDVCERCDGRGFTHAHTAPKTLDFARLVGADAEPLADAVSIAEGLLPALAAKWGAKSGGVVLRLARHVPSVHLAAGHLLESSYHREVPATVAAVRLCTAMQLPNPRTGATPRRDTWSELALAWGALSVGKEEAIADAILRSAALAHPIDGYDARAGQIAVVVPADRLI